jgi:hypothetical protein
MAHKQLNTQWPKGADPVFLQDYFVTAIDRMT